MYSPKNQQKGVAVIIALLLISVMLAIVTTLSAIFAPKIRLAGEIRRSVSAAYAADSGIEFCLYVTRKEPIPAPIMSNGSVVTVTDCNISPVRSTGSFQGVTRAFEVTF